MRPLLATMLLIGTAGCGRAADVVISEADPNGAATPATADPDLFSDPEFSKEPTVRAEVVTSTEPPLTVPPPTVPPSTFLPPDADQVALELGGATYDLPACPDTERGAVTDKANQRYWLCMEGVAVTDEIPMTTASSNYGLPPVGTYEVFARDQEAVGIDGQALERFVAFYTTPRGNRIAFHEVVDQDPATVGDLDQRGASAGCFRVREADSVQVWDFLQVGDPVVVLTN